MDASLSSFSSEQSTSTSSSSSSSIFLEDFGQKVDLTRRIREVLLNYPEGTTVLKELIQNADDAGATKVCLCLDRRSHGADSVLSEKLAEWQGPALLAYNDAVFTEEDFVSISRIGGSQKRGQAWKTGRFGVGFNSVYHLTDLPSFVSGKYVVLFDPQGVYLPNISTANPGKRIEYVSSSAISLYKDQFLPYCAFGCDMKSPFHGTLFRFPLRNADQAASSKLSKQAYLEDDILSMFAQLYEEGILSLLFLKNVLSIEMYVWDGHLPEPRRIYSCSIDSVDEDIVWHRQAVLRLSKLSNSCSTEKDSFSLNFISEAMNGNNLEKRSDTFYIMQTMASSSSRIGSFAARAAKDFDIHLLPWASVAACLSNNSSNDNALQLGRVFCFLPLPVKSGLHVQINGYFEVSSNRRGIWYGDDMDRSGRMRSMWNRLLLEDVVAPSFAKLLLGLRNILGPSEFYYHLWPTGSFEEPWSALVENIFRATTDEPLLYSCISGGRWVSPRISYLHDMEFSKSKELEEALVQLDMPVVVLPNGLLKMLISNVSGVQAKVVTPDSVRRYLSECRNTCTISRSNKLMLLEYCLEDLVDTDVGSCASSLPLLPLANDDFGLLSEASEGNIYFICNDLEYMLLQKISDRVIDKAIPQNISDRLTAIAKVSGANLALFSVHDCVSVLSNFIPAEWKYKTKVLWDPASNSTYPSSSWFVLFWRYLREGCNNLSLFSDWPILPSHSNHLYRPSKHSKLLNVEGLSGELLQVLIKIGCKILNRNFGVDHPDLGEYVYYPDIIGVLESIFDIVYSNEDIQRVFYQILKSEEIDELRKFLLDPKWYIRNNMDDSHMLKCKRLPIYRVHGREPSHFQYSNLINSRKYLPPRNCPVNLLGDEFISSPSTEEEVLNRYYGIERMGKARFYKQSVFSRIKELDSDCREAIMLSILKELPQLCVEDASFKEILRNLEFVPTCHGSLKSPIMLYDPRNEELFALLEDSDSFPSSAFQDPNILDMLQALGLNTTVSMETVIQSARHIEHLMHADQEQAHLKGKVLLSYLEVNALKWLPDLGNDKGTINRIFVRAANALRPRHLDGDLEKFWNDLQLICWCPVLASTPFKSLPWPTVSSVVAPPKLVRLYKDMWLVSASMRILDGECSSSALTHLLGWSSPPGGSVVAAQLLELGKNNEMVYDSLLRQELAMAMPRIYSLLMGMIGSDEMDIVKAILEGCRWVWVGDGFATLDEVVLNGPLHLAPYIRVIPIDLAAFKDLFLELGIREFLQPSNYADILTRIASKKGVVPLDSQELSAVILIAQHLAEAQHFEDQMQIYLPDMSCRLYKASDLVYNDAPWLLDSENTNSSISSSVTLSSRQPFQIFVHGNISNDVSEKLGVRSFRRMLLAESADSLNFSLSGAAEAFGQHEALTTRLRHILEMYADGPSTLFELVQNAEDANASQVIFLLDKTQYGTSSVLSPEMADWQGPALYCYNDSVFSSQDLYAISRIGQESKLEKPLAIGRFGLGFNCVYHFTDIPTFVSGENIVMFDPHASNLPGISPSHPGLRIKFVGSNILEQFPNQFSPFLHFDCDLQHPYPGTLFRFPLRSAGVASRSQIKKEEYAPDDVLALFSAFSDVVSETLLFLRNVKTISLYVKEGANFEMQLLHSVHKNNVSDHEAENNPSNEIFCFIDGSMQHKMDWDQILYKMSKSLDQNLPWRCQKIVVSEERLSGCKSHFWLTGECLGGSGIRSGGKFTAVEKNFFKFVPWACVALQINSLDICKDSDKTTVPKEWSVTLPETLQSQTASGLIKRNFDGRAFCFLPLPIKTGLPVHVNAYFELSSNRRDIWFGNDMAGGGKVRSDWNMYLLEEVVAPAYGHLLERLALEIGPCDLYFSFWPVTGGSEPWGTLVRKLYQFVVGQRVFYTKARGGQWISARQAILPDFTFDKASELIDALSDAGLPITTVPKVLVDMFKEICPSLYFLSPQLLRTLLTRRKREFGDRNSMILALEYCLLDFELPIRPDSFYGIPLIPLSNGSFANFEERGSNELIYITEGDGFALLKNSIPHQIIDSAISDYLYKKFSDVALSEQFNISYLTCPRLEKLFLNILPAEWENAKQVTWVPERHGHPSSEWIRLLWSYLKSHCDDLSLFSKWPILPVENNYLLQLVENSNVIENVGWSENMSSLLQRVGCLLLRHDLLLEHPDLKQYVQSSTAVGVLNALLVVAGKRDSIEKLFGDSSEGELLELRSFILQSKWFSENYFDTTYISIIKNIPMFESFKSRKLVALSNKKWLKPEGILDDLLNDDFIRADSSKEKVILTKYLGLEEPSRINFYKDFVLTHMSEFINEESLLLDILYNVRSLIEEDYSCKTVFSTVPFVQACNGSWKEPCRLYDPRIPELKMLLHGGALFPSDKFSNPETLDTLVKLGLKQTLGCTGLLDCAMSVSMLNDSADQETIIFAKRFLCCLSTLTLKLSILEGGDISLTSHAVEDVHGLNPGISEENYCSTRSSRNPYEHGLDCDIVVSKLIDDLPTEEFWSELRVINWCPIYSEPPWQGIPWLQLGHRIAAPVITRPKSQMWMASCKMNILDGECSEELKRKLGWMDPLDAEILCAQLVAISKCLEEVDSQHVAELHEQIRVIYAQLQEYVVRNELHVIKSVLDGVSWVWIGDEFVNPNALAFDSPVKFSPYLYVVPSELFEFRELLLALGVRHSFDVLDYFEVLKQLQNDVKDSPLSTDQFNFVRCILEAIADYDLDDLMCGSLNILLLVPDSYGVLESAGNLVYNDAPWMGNSALVGKRLVHPSISCDLANKLGIQSVRFLSLVSQEMTKDLPCMDYGRVCELLDLYGRDFILFDVLELADCCKAKKLHLIFDKREHPRQSLLQHNLGEFQGPALLAVMEGASLNGDEIASLQFLPPWSFRGGTLSYGLGLLSCFSISDLISVISDDCLYMLDPRGVALSTPSSRGPAAKMFSLKGTNLIERFRDQFSPMLVGQNIPGLSSYYTIIRMPLSSASSNEATESGFNQISLLLNNFKDHASRTLLFLKSVLQVSLSTWNTESPEPHQDFSIGIDPSAAIYRNPFSEKKWKKFQLSSLFSSSSAAVKLQVIDMWLCEEGTRVDDKWLVVLSMGSGQTRNMALDRRYMAYNLTPVAGVAAHILRNGNPIQTSSSSFIMSPLPLSSVIYVPITVLGYFLVRHNRGRFLFKCQDSETARELQSDAGSPLIEAWNRELMSCVQNSYIKLVLEVQKLRREPSTSVLESNCGHVVGSMLDAYGDQIYTFWPRSHQGSCSIPETLAKADWTCLVQQVIRPFYARLIDFPVWQLYSGNLVKADEGMFLSQPSSKVADRLLPSTVCSFVREHYPVFSVPWDLVTEIQAVGITVREIKPKMVRDLLRGSSSIVLRSVDTYIDVLEYCLSDIQFHDVTRSGVLNTSSGASGSGTSISSIPQGSRRDSGSGSSVGRRHVMSASSNASGGDALDMMTSLGKALFDFGRGVVEDIGRSGSPLSQKHTITGGSSIGTSFSGDGQLASIVSELRGLPCPTATNHLIRLGFSEIWVGNKEQQSLMVPLATKFIHHKVLDKPFLLSIFSNLSLQSLLNLYPFSLHLLVNHMRFIFHENWVSHVVDSSTAPWFSWDNTASTSTEVGPSSEWIRLFWKVVSSSSDDISLFTDWPLIPAFLGRPVLCRVRERHLIFIPSLSSDLNSTSAAVQIDDTEDNMSGKISESKVMQSYFLSFKATEEKFPWLFSLLNQCNLPIFDNAFIECASACQCLPPANHSLGQVIALKLVAAKQAGYFPENVSFLPSDRDALFDMYASDFSSNFEYGREQIEFLRDLPIYKTASGAYTRIQGQDLCIISSNTFLKPSDERCLSLTTESAESSFLKALGVPELQDEQIFVKFGLPRFEEKRLAEQEDILIYLHTNWKALLQDPSIIEVLKETHFVKNADEQSMDLCRPKDLYDPRDTLLTCVFSGVKEKFPGERFTSDGWLLILRKAGLRTSTEIEVVLECAKRVEYLGGECITSRSALDALESDRIISHNEVSLELWLLAENLIKHIFSNFAVLYGNNFCNLLGKISCVPAEKGSPNVGGRGNGKRVLCSYKDAIILQDWSLAWSCAPILSRQSVVPPEYAWGPLQLRSPPAFSVVLKHLQGIGKNNGEDTLAHWSAATGLKTMDEASYEVFRYLDKIWGSLSSSDIMELKQVAFVPVANGTRLVTASSLFARLSVNLSPFAFELPAQYLPFVSILKDLGLQDALSVAFAKDLLSNLQKACGYQRLNPNEFRAVEEILYFICDEANTSVISSWGSEAIVPDDGCRLVHARLCVFIDSYGARYVKNIDMSQLRFVHQDLSESVCKTLGIKKLSDVVVEELDHRKQLQPIDCIGSVSLATIKQKLLSKSFQRAVWGVLDSIASGIPGFHVPCLENVCSLIESIAEKLKFVDRIYTRFELLPKSLDITLVDKESIIPDWEDNASLHRALFFVNQLKTCLLVAKPPNYIYLSDVIASVVSQVLDSPVLLPIGSLILCPKDSEATTVDVLKLCSHKKANLSRDGADHLLGREILAQDAVQVQFHPLRPFYTGEMVAWRSQNGEKLKYGRVPENVKPSAGQALYRFNVETSPGVTEQILSSNVFSFRSISISTEDAAAAVVVENNNLTDDDKTAEVPESVGIESSKQSVQDLQHGKVSTVELVQAVHEMLSAAGVNMDVEKQSLLQTTLTLQENLKESQAALLLEQEKSEMAMKEADTAKAAWSCRVCLSNEVDVTIVPCGHVLCRRCSSAVSRCPFCRLQVSKTIRIFRP